MRVIARKTLIHFWKKHADSEQQLKAWFDEMQKVFWKSPKELKSQFRAASIINEKRVVFNIKGNSYRLIVDIEYRLEIIFIVWVGTHSEYDCIDVKRIGYDKGN